MFEEHQLDDYFSFFAEELLFWHEKYIPQKKLLQSLFELSESDPLVFLFKLKGNTVQIIYKKNAPEYQGYIDRANRYRSFLSKVVEIFPLEDIVVIALYVSDGEALWWDCPTFAFQKNVNSMNFLLPDVDFLAYDFYQGDEFRCDEKDFVDKLDGAIFVGSTTGAPNVTFNKQMLLTNLVPRVNSAMYFKDKSDVVFKLPSIVQHADIETYEYLRSLGIGDGVRMSYQEQFNYKFMISMDGNGATCSRVALTLKSNTILLKYKSSSLLFYFKMLTPWIHYIPVDNDADVLTIVDFEKQQPGIFSSIVKNANKFYNDYLTQDKLIRYTACLLHYYAKSLFSNDRSFESNGNASVRTWDPCQLPSEVGCALGRGIESTGKAGFLIYGPYISLPAGDYLVVFHGAAISNRDDAWAKVDVVMYNGAITLAEVIIKNQRRDGCLANVKISSDIPYVNLEFRIWVGEDYKMEVYQLELRKIQ